MVFANRQVAGILLGNALHKYQNKKNVVVIGLARGGVVIAYEVAKILHAKLDVICTRKIGAPFNPEFAIGAITESGEGFFNLPVIQELGVSKEYLHETIEKEKKVAQHRYSIFRQGCPPISLKEMIVILTDDGLATGATMKAAIKSVKTQGTKKIVIAIPVAPAETVLEMKSLVDEIVCLETPPFFQAIGQFYQDFSQVEEDEVIQYLNYKGC